MEQNFEDTHILNLSMTRAPKVLLVDDDELVATHLKALVEDAGFQALTAPSAEQALQSLERDFTPIVILDRSMPGMDGLSLCRAIRAKSYPGYVYVLLLTVHDAEGDILAGLDAGADDYLSKRASPAQLLARLRTAQRILSLEFSLKSAIEDRRKMAMTDALTGAHNRRYFVRHLERELKRTLRFGGELAVLLLDIDHFKRVNDTYGHSAGDEVLKAFVQRLHGNLPREVDWFARLGGEEFAVVLPQTELAGAGEVAERLRQQVEATPMATTAGRIQVTTSIGISGLQTLPRREAASTEELLDQADRALYASKEGGRNRVSTAERQAG